MKRLYFVIAVVCVASASLFIMMENTSANKGRPYYEQAGQIFWDVKTEEKLVALTFDDGPHQKHTSDVLDLLAQYNAKATKFI